MVNVTATATTLATDYTNLGSYIGLATGNPGSTTTPANEATGGSPSYARQETTWNVSGTQALGTEVTFNVPSGTYNYMIFCSAATGNNMIDWAPMSPLEATGQTTITVVPLTTVS